MRTIELPVLRATNCAAVFMERVELAGCASWVVSVRAGPNSPVRRRWLPEEAAAVSYAAQVADRLGLLLIDLRGPED